MNVGLGSMLSKKSPQTSCRIRIRNDRIGANGFLNQRCALAPDLESILRARMSKIVFRQHRPKADQGLRHDGSSLLPHDSEQPAFARTCNLEARQCANY